MRVSAAFIGRVILIGIFARAAVALAEGEPLHAVIDERLTPVTGLEPARCSDAEFLRRVSLDLTGMPPTADEARAFISDSATDKREHAIDRLFASPHYVRHLAAVLDVILMERRPNTHITADEWQAWLLKCVRENVPWNVLVRQILEADGETGDKRPAARFVLDRGSDPNGITRDIGRIFFGRDMQCAQCHDHPLVSDYLQSDYHGLLAFVSPSYALVRKEGDKQVTLQAEKAGSDATFESVFVGVPRRTGPRMPDGVVLDEPLLLPGEEYEVAPAENVKSVPKYSRRSKLAELATDGSNEAFNWNIANRLWAHMFGRGLVHPPDLHHPQNPPSDPELLRILADYFVRMNFNIRLFLREIALSGAYQRSLDPPANLLEASEQVAAEISRLEQQRLAFEKSSQASSEAYTAATDAWQDTEAAWLPVAAELDTARNQYGEAKKKVDEAVKAVADATAQLQAKKSVADPVQQAATAAQAAVKSLPEDKELADAAQKFVTRAAKLAEESAALTKTVEEKTAVVGPMTDEWNKTKPPVEAAHTKVTPLKESIITAEQTMLEARTKAARDAEALAAIDRRLAAARLMAQVPQLQRAVAAANEALPPLEAEFAAAEKQLNEFAAVVAQHDARSTAAAAAVADAASALKSAAAEHTLRADAAKSIAAAYAAVAVAREKLPDDASLADVANQLQTRSTIAQSQTAEYQKQVEALTAAQKSAEESFVAVQETLAAALAERSRREQAVASAKQSLTTAQTECAAKQSAFDAAQSDLNERWTRDFTMASLKPLTPEQLCWTVFRVTGVYDRYWQAEVAELDKTKPFTDEQKNDSDQVAARQVELEQRTYDKLKGNIATFVAFYGAAAGQPQGDFFSTADQALFAANGGSINSWVAPAGDNVTERIIKNGDLRVAAEELYLGVLTRFPTDEEMAEIVAYLTARSSDKSAAAQELVWALMNSAEFRFNH
jgi:hypothetical protein